MTTRPTRSRAGGVPSGVRHLLRHGAAVLAMAALTFQAHPAARGDTPLPIVPGAAGFGITTPAGSGRHLTPPATRVIKVTTLATEGPGSFREALEAEGPRTIVFEVSGNIDFTPCGDLSIRHPYVTVAGQTAPSPGITLKGCQMHVRAHDVLLQHMRIRVGDLRDPARPLRNKAGWTQWSERDCMKVGGDRVVLDHCSFSWATDENVQTRGNDLTLRHCIFSEGLDSAKHHKGGHSRGLLIMNQGPPDTRQEGQRVAVIGNLFAHNKGRNPTVNGGATAVVANNLVCDANFALKGDCTAKRGHQFISWQANVIERTNAPVVARAMHPETRYHVGTGNLFNGTSPASFAHAWEFVKMPFKPGVAQVNRAAEPPITVPGLRIRPAPEVKAWVLDRAGARPSDRGPVDARLIDEVRTGEGHIIAGQADVGGWPDLAENRRPLTLPDAPCGDDDGDGYTNLEQWLHGFAAEVEGR